MTTLIGGLLSILMENRSGVYTGIGSRKLPNQYYDLFVRLAQILSNKGYTCRSGGADGADSAFEEGSLLGRRTPEIYLPWKGFNDRNEGGRLVHPFEFANWKEAQKIASTIHPYWSNLKSSYKDLHTRNVYQIIGKNLLTPSEFVVCWAEPEGDYVKGGTRTAVVLAKRLSIPVYNFYGKEDYLEFFMEKLK